MIVGQIVRPQGIRGELKVKPLTADPSRFCVLEYVNIGDRRYTVKNARINGGDVYITLEGVSDRNAAEDFRGAMLEIERADAIPLDAGEFYISDLIGCTLVAIKAGGETEIGVISRIESFGAADVFSVTTERGQMSLAFVKALKAEYNDKNRTLTVDGSVLDTVAIYEN